MTHETAMALLRLAISETGREGAIRLRAHCLANEPLVLDGQIVGTGPDGSTIY